MISIFNAEEEAILKSLIEPEDTKATLLLRLKTIEYDNGSLEDMFDEQIKSLVLKVSGVAEDELQKLKSN